MKTSNRVVSLSAHREKVLRSSIYMLGQEILQGSMTDVQLYERIDGYIKQDGLSRETLVGTLESHDKEFDTTLRFGIIDAYDFATAVIERKKLVRELTMSSP